MHDDEKLRAELAEAMAECGRLRQENAKLRMRLGDSDAYTNTEPIAARKEPARGDTSQDTHSVTNSSNPEIKVSLFRKLFRGRDDVYAVRWEGRGNKAGYSPAGIRDGNSQLPRLNPKSRRFRTLLGSTGNR